ncbi:hypothetical protein PMAYCL1PPCAC_26152, partial [Pristionchus mayeri]
FELMSYRLTTDVKPLIWVEAEVVKYRGRVDYVVKAKSQFKNTLFGKDVDIIIPVPSDASSPKFKKSVGTVKYAADLRALVWTIRRFPGGREFLMSASFSLPSIHSEEIEGKPPITVKFEIPHLTSSGLQVRYLKVNDKSGYNAFQWVKYSTKNGDYQMRMQ